VAQTINTNVHSINAQRRTDATQSALSVTVQRLSSGLRVNSAKDDAAGLAISERMQAQVAGMSVAVRNANDGISMAQTAEGATAKIGEALQRMRELAVQSATGTQNEGDRSKLQTEFTALQEEVDRLVSGTRFNGHSLLDGSGGNGGVFTLQVGATTDASDTLSVTMTDLSGTSSDVAVLSIEGTDASASTAAIVGLDAAINDIAVARSNFGALQNRIEGVISNLQTSSENLSAARSRIVDADYAVETASLSRSRILQQAGNAMIAQANQAPSQVMQLLAA
jgi:flagellin